MLSLPAAKDLVERLAQLYGVGRARAMRRVDHEAGAYKVSGYAALPSVTEASRSRQTVSVNGRWVRADALTRGVDDAYRATVAAGRYPPVALGVEVDPHQVDVNVHPTKQLVRFSEEKEVRQAVSEAVRNAIQGTEDRAPEQDGRGTEPGTSGTYPPPAGEGGTDAPLAARERHAANETRPSVPTGKKLTGTNNGGSVSSDSLFEISKGSGSHPSKAPDLAEQRGRVQQASAPLSRLRILRSRHQDYAPAPPRVPRPRNRGVATACRSGIRGPGRIGSLPFRPVLKATEADAAPASDFPYPPLLGSSKSLPGQSRGASAFGFRRRGQRRPPFSTSRRRSSLKPLIGEHRLPTGSRAACRARRRPRGGPSPPTPRASGRPPPR